MLARAEAHVLRLYRLYALLDRSAEIKAEHLLAALALWDYAERSVLFIFGDSMGDPVADDLLRQMRATPMGLTRSQALDCFGRHVSADRIGRALGLLLQHHLARFEQVQTGGRLAERWFAVPKVRYRGLFSLNSVFSQGGGRKMTVLEQAERVYARIKVQRNGHVEAPILQAPKCEESEKSEKSPHPNRRQGGATGPRLYLLVPDRAGLGALAVALEETTPVGAGH